LKDRRALIKRLGPYWKMEAGNAVLLPALMVYFSKGSIGWVSATATLPMIIMLVVGAVYWRAKLFQLRQRDYDIRPTLDKIAAVQVPVLVLTSVGSVVAVTGWLIPGMAISYADNVCASIAAILAILEYVNYYHRQLQHFDNIADFRRLTRGRGFRASQMANDLRAHGFR
jgi:hypothetical protein